MNTATLHAFVYLRMFFEVLIVNPIQCTFGDIAHCSNATTRCSSVLANGLGAVYRERIDKELEANEDLRKTLGLPPEDEGPWSPTSVRIYAEQSLVCSYLPPRCNTESCAEDFRIARPYWLELWRGKDPDCPKRLCRYVCSKGCDHEAL